MKREECRDMLEIMKGCAREIRCCSQDETFFGALTFNQFIILDLVAQKKEMPLADLHGLLAVEKSTTTRLLNPLVRKGLLTRDKSSHDSRAAKLRLTPEGKSIHKKVWSCLDVFFQGILNNLPESRKSEVLESVKAFINAIRATMDQNCCSSKK